MIDSEKENRKTTSLQGQWFHFIDKIMHVQIKIKNKGDYSIMLEKNVIPESTFIYIYEINSR